MSASNDDLAGYVAELERKVERLETAVRQIHARLDATTSVTSRDVTRKLTDALQGALDDLERRA